MERNHFVKKFDHIKGTSDDQISGLGQAKSYACTFCKRGFSNAQALGGHMNIHRRDRARMIRQYSEDQNQLSSDEAKGASTSVHHDPPRGSNSEEKTLSQLMDQRKGTNMTPRKPSHPFPATSEHHKVLVRSEEKMIGSLEDIEEQLQLPFLLEEPVSATKKLLAGCTNIVGGVTELDLELRLGPEPLETNLSTREFF